MAASGAGGLGGLCPEEQENRRADRIPLSELRCGLPPAPGNQWAGERVGYVGYAPGPWAQSGGGRRGVQRCKRSRARKLQAFLL